MLIGQPYFVHNFNLAFGEHFPLLINCEIFYTLRKLLLKLRKLQLENGFFFQHKNT